MILLVLLYQPAPVAPAGPFLVIGILASFLELGPGVILTAFSSILSILVYYNYSSEYIITPRGDTSG